LNARVNVKLRIMPWTRANDIRPSREQMGPVKILHLVDHPSSNINRH
jgi:hypothetical protein